MKLYVTTNYPQHDGAHMLNWIRMSAQLDVYRKHQLWDDPETADAILFFEGHSGTDPLRLGVLLNPIYRKFRNKCFLYHDGDDAFPFMRGLYPSLLKRHHRPGWCEGAPYFARQAVNKAVSAAANATTNQEWLTSFVGANNCTVRATILSWNHPQIYIQDTSGKQAWELPEEDRNHYQASYANICLQSQSILAPKGFGPSSYRLYEAMELKRCPVVISDDWVAPPAMDWKSCSIQVSDKVLDLQNLLATLKKAPLEDLSACAGEMYEQNLAPNQAWNYLSERISHLKENIQSSRTNLRLASCLTSTHRRLLFKAMCRSLKASRRLFS